MNLSSCDALEPLFPGTDNFYGRRLDNALAVIVQALPLLVTALAWIVLELLRRPRNLPRPVHTAFKTVAFACTLASSVVVWRVVVLVTCDEPDATVLAGILSVVGFVGTSGLLLVLLSNRFLRASILFALLCSAGTVTADVLLRELDSNPARRAAAAHLPTLQNVCNIHAACLLFALPRSKRTRAVMTTPVSRASLAVVDALA